MKQKIRRVNFIGRVDYQHEASSALLNAGDVVLVERGRPRMLVMRCPCDCGDDLLINLDTRVGKAWRFYFKAKGLTLYPSYWRDDACQSHFILWDDKIYWCHRWGERDDDSDLWSVSDSVEIATDNALGTEFLGYWDLADRLNILPWEALQACRQLERKGKALEGRRENGGKFRRP